MTENQRREQILKMRQQAVGPAVPSLSDAEAQKIVTGNSGLTEEQMIAVAMFGKVIQNDVKTIKKAGMGDLKVTDVDMSKVMPSGIAKVVGPQNMPLPSPLTGVPTNLPLTPTLSPPLQVQPILPQNPPSDNVAVNRKDENQLEFDFEKKARYQDVVDSLEKIENKINELSIKLNSLHDLVKKN